MGGMLVGCLIRVFWGVRLWRSWGSTYRGCVVLLIIGRLLLEERVGEENVCWYLGKLCLSCHKV